MKDDPVERDYSFLKDWDGPAPTDLAQRLREDAAQCAESWTDKDPTVILLREAADAIDSLTAERDAAESQKTERDLRIRAEARLAAVEAERDDWRDHVFADGVRLAAAERVLRSVERSYRHSIRVASGEVQSVWDVDGGTMRDVQAWLEKAYSGQVDINPPSARDVSTSEPKHTRWADVKAKRNSSKQTAETYNDSGDVKGSDNAADLYLGKQDDVEVFAEEEGSYFVPAPLSEAEINQNMKAADLNFSKPTKEGE